MAQQSAVNSLQLELWLVVSKHYQEGKDWVFKNYDIIEHLFDIDLTTF